MGGAKFFMSADISCLKKMDRTFAVSINAKNIFKPLYQDNSIFGYFFGFIARLFKIIIGVIFYIATSLIFLLMYVFVAGIIPFLIYKIITS